MTDVSQFDAPSRFTGGSAFVDLDAHRVERNREAIDLVEASWRLPAVPDLVKLDLATSAYATPESLSEVLSGIDEDLHRPTSDDDVEQEPLVPRQPLSGVDQARILLAAASSNPPPQRVTSDATERFKLRAIDAGLLDMNPDRIDGSWSPEMNRIRGELAYDDYNRSLRGDRPGAMPFGRAIQILGDLTSPAGLLSFATDLDLFWDFDAISHEASSWGDKWRKLDDSDGPFDFAKNLVDALTGPIDDIVFPIINVGLLFTGFGAVTNSARVGWMGRNLARAAGSFGNLYGESRIGRALVSGMRGIGEGFEAGARLNLAEIGRPSMMAERLMRGARGVERGSEAFGQLGAGTRFAARNGDLLARWRGLAPVIQTKRGVQQGMRLGLVSYAEDAFPGYQGGGPSLSDIPAVDSGAEWLYRQNMNPKFMPLELMFAPYNVFAPGTFFRRAGEGTALISRTGRGARRALGTTPGRAAAGGLAGAIGGAVVGDDAGDIAEGAALGAGGLALAPAFGRALEVERLHQGVTGALLGAGAGLVLGDSPEDVALGALAGTGIVALPNSVRRRVYNQVGVSGLDRLLRGVGHQMVRTNYQLVEADPDIALGFHAKMKRLLADTPDDLAQWDMDVNSYGVVGALAKRSYGKVDQGTRDVAAATISFDYTTFSLDWIAHAQSSAVQGTRRRRHAYHMARNKLTNQLRPVDLDRPAEDIIEDVAKIMAWTDTRGARPIVDDLGNVPRFVDQSGDALFRVRRRQRELVATLTPERAVELAEQHNRQIGDTIGQLFEHQNFPKVEDFTSVPRGETNLFGDRWADTGMSARAALYANHGGWDNFGDFRSFTEATQGIRSARADGLFDAAVLKPVTTRRGRLRAPKAGAGVDFFDPTSDKAQQALTDLIAKGVDPSRLGDLKVTPWAQAHEAGRVTAARSDFVTKQQVEEVAERVADVLAMQRLLPKLAKGWHGALAPEVAGRAVSEMNRAELGVLLNEVVKAGVKPKSASQVISFAKHHKLTLADVTAGLDRITGELLDTTDWTRYGFGNIAADADGKILTGTDALAARLRELRDKAPFTAAELDMDALARYYDDVAAGRPVAQYEYLGRTYDDEAATAAAKAEFDALGDDDIVVVYHGTGRKERDAILASGQIKPGESTFMNSESLDAGAMYVSPTYDEAATYGSSVLELRVRKGDLRNSTENATRRGGKTAGDGLFDPYYGAVVPQGAKFEAVAAEGRKSDSVMDAVFGGGGRGAAEIGSTPAMRSAARDAAAKASRVRDLARDAEARGYKHVHGVEFLMPEDVAFGMPTFADATRRHMNAVTLGNWFGRRQPIEAWARDDRRRRLALVDELAKVGKDMNPSDNEVENILGTLERWLRREQEVGDESLRLAHQQGGIAEKTTARIRSSLVPVRLDDVGGFSRRQAAIIDEMRTIGYTEAEATAIWKAVSRFRQSDFAETGLYGLEAAMRNNNQAAAFLKMLGGTRYGDSVLAKVSGQAAAGAAVGALAAGDDASFEDRLKAAVLGGAVGAGVAAAVRPKMITAAEGWRYGYLADGFARLRDSLRFTLSPFFDLSRYTEGIVLSQTAVPLRHADGSRVAMPMFSGLRPVAAASPHGLRRRLARDAMRSAEKAAKEGTGTAISKREARRLAVTEYEGFVDEFNAASKGAMDFDRDAMDSVGRWYRQVGVVGFSPTDWMATAYASLRGQGFGMPEAYKASREMYTYGSTGRSAAELSVNMIFFPFSFQKKALTHIGKWLNDDLGRSIILHDALKTYETLDERYDLDRRWKDHIPYLQQLQRLNLFAYGISPGRFGGINSQLFESVGKVAWNAFTPFGVKIQDAAAASELQDLGRQLMPVWNDINWMIHDTSEVLIPNLVGAIPGTPMEAQSYRAQVRDGWNTFNRVRDDYEVALAEKGYTLADLHSKPWLAEGLADYQARIAEVAERYPAWFDARTEIPGNAIALDMEKDLYMQRVLIARSRGEEPSVDAQQVAEMQEFIDGYLDRMQLVHGVRDTEFAPPEMFAVIRDKAIEFAERNPHFRPLWNRFWRRDFGLIDEPLEIG